MAKGAGSEANSSTHPLSHDRDTRNPGEDLRFAHKVLMAMTPQRLPAVEGIDLAALYVPCTAVAGDLYDVLEISEDLLAFILFDIAGQGVSSALVSAMAKVSFMRHVNAETTPRSVLSRVCKEVAGHLDAEGFVTAFVGYLNLHSNSLTYSICGNLHPLVFRAKDRTVHSLRASGALIGESDNGFVHERSIFLNPADWLILCTNGVYFLYDRTDEHAGRTQFEAGLPATLDGISPSQFTASLRKRCELPGPAAGPVEDDVVLLAVEVLSQSRRKQILQRLGFGTHDQVYLQFISYFEEMDNAIGTILRSMDNQGYGDEVIRKMKITLTELVVNALYHGNQKDPGKKVTIGHTIDRNRIAVSIMDEGPGFDPAVVPDPTLPENLTKDSGRGLYIVRCYVDEMRFNTEGNRIAIIKYAGK